MSQAGGVPSIYTGKAEAPVSPSWEKTDTHGKESFGRFASRLPTVPDHSDQGLARERLIDVAVNGGSSGRVCQNWRCNLACTARACVCVGGGAG